MSTAPVPAAQYLRMSTDQQQYSILNQSAAIQLYATLHGFAIVQTYADEGRSGVVIRRRSQLQRLLSDVTSRKAPYKAVLVYDVSRWGRFQDMDEAAHYEFLCKKSGVPVHYCQEAFANDGAMANLILKWIKRAMAGEYSRELSNKVFAGLVRLASMGFKTGGVVGHGLQRMLVGPDREPKQILAFGQRKSIAEDRVILVPGPAEDVRWVRKIFEMFLQKNMMPSDIARYLNEKGIPYKGGITRKYWYPQAVNRLLKDPKYAGWQIYGRFTQKLKTPRRKVVKDQWITVRDAWEPLIDQPTFDATQAKFHSQTYFLSDNDLLDHLRHLLKQHGKITHKIIAKSPGPSIGAYQRRLGSLTEAMHRIGYDGPMLNRLEPRRFMREKRRELIQQIVSSSSEDIIIEQPDGHWRERLIVQDGLLVSIYLVRQYATKDGKPRWILNPVLGEGRTPALIARMTPDNNGFRDFYLVAGTGKRTRFTLKENDAWLHKGWRLESLADFCQTVRDVAAQNGLMPQRAVEPDLPGNRIRFA